MKIYFCLIILLCGNLLLGETLIESKMGEYQYSSNLSIEHLGPIEDEDLNIMKVKDRALSALQKSYPDLKGLYATSSALISYKEGHAYLFVFGSKPKRSFLKEQKFEGNIYVFCSIKGDPIIPERKKLSRREMEQE